MHSAHVHPLNNAVPLGRGLGDPRDRRLVFCWKDN